MRHLISTAGMATMLGATVALAEVPRVATDIAPVQSLAAQVMGSLGEPAVILPPGASPHGYAMRPSEAQALAKADVVFWIGEGLTPWLERPLASLAGSAAVVELSEAPGVTRLPYRQGATFEAHHHDGDAGEDEAAEGADHDYEDALAGHEHEDAADHDHHGDDPHLWLDPGNARAWLTAMAEALAAADPQNAAAYRANAAAAVGEIDRLEGEIAAEMAPLHDLRFIVFHDAFQYYEHRFGLQAAGAISLGDARDPGAARVAEIRDLVRDQDIACVAAEPQFKPGLVATVTEGTGAKTTVLDPIGVGLAPGPELYRTLLRNIAAGFEACE